jgi:hypothetical protein
MKFYVAKGLQFLGLIIVPMALLVGLMEQRNAMTRELTILLIGALVFLVGYFIEDRE